MQPANIMDRLKKIKAKRDYERRVALYSLLLEKFILLTGTKGTGKTSSGIHLAYNLREFTDRPVIVVGTLMGIKPEFGPFEYLDAADFICQMRVISRTAPDITPDLSADEIEILLLNQRGCPNQEHDPNYVQLLNNQWKHKDKVSEKALGNIQGEGEECRTAREGVILYRTIVLLDEANEFIGGESASNPLVRLFTKSIQMMRHLRITLIAMLPYREDAAPRVRGQVDTFGACVTMKNLGYTKITFSDGVLREHEKLIYPFQKYWDMYESFNILQIRGRNLNIGAKYI